MLFKEYSTQHWIKLGLNISKLVFGIPTYGRGYELESSDVHGEYAPTNGFSKFGEFINYNKVKIDFSQKNLIIFLDLLFFKQISSSR